MSEGPIRRAASRMVQETGGREIHRPDKETLARMAEWAGNYIAAWSKPDIEFHNQKRLMERAFDYAEDMEREFIKRRGW